MIFTTGFHWLMDQEFSKSNQILQTKGMNIVNYYVKLKQLWDALAKYDQPLTCKYEGSHVILDRFLTRNKKRKGYITFLWG